MAAAVEVPAHDVTAVRDCTTAGCPNEATERGPSGNWYCLPCKKRIYAKKVETTTARHGTGGGGQLRQQLVAADRSDVETDELARRLRTELKTLERAVNAHIRTERRVRDAHSDCAKTIREIIGRVNELAQPVR